MLIPLVDHTPQIVSVLPSTTVHTRLLLVEGFVPDVASGPVQIIPHRNHIPTQSATIVDSMFKTLIPLTPGENEIQLIYYCSKANRPFSSYFDCTYIPLVNNPPLKLVIIAGSDSQCTFDDAPNPKYPVNIHTAVKRLRFAGYLWAAYTNSQMSAGGLGERTFRLNDEWTNDTISNQEDGRVYRQTAKIEVLRAKYSVAEIRNPDRAQQNKAAGAAGSLFDIALQTLRENPGTNGPLEHVAALFIDAHFEPQSGLITGHAALGGGSAQHKLAIFGSHTIFSWPTCLEDMEPCFSNPREVDKSYCGVDGEGRTYWSACNVGIGAMMHEVGHLFGCPHQESGVMLRDYVRLHRSLTAIEPQEATKVVGSGTCQWHRLDLLRFRGHDGFRLPHDKPYPHGGVSCLGTEEGLFITSPSGLKSIEIFLDNHEFPKSWIETDDIARLSSGSATAMTLRESVFRSRIGGASGTIKLSITAHNNTSLTVPDVSALLTPSHIPGFHGLVWKSPEFGINDGTQIDHLIFPDQVSKIRIFSGACLDSIEFLPSRTSEPCKFGGSGGAEHVFELARGEYITGLKVRSGLWVDAVQFVTNTRVSPVYGNPGGGSAGEVVLPDEYRIVGLFGRVGGWVVRLGVLYARR